MDIRPILSTLRRHKTAAALIVLEVALTCAIVCNALFLVTQRVERISQTSGLAENELVFVRSAASASRPMARPAPGGPGRPARVPGVTAAAKVNQLPFRPNSSNTSVSLKQEQERPTAFVTMYMFGEGGLSTLGLQLTAGRDFQPSEYSNVEDAQKNASTNTASSVIISRTLADRLYPGENALGKTFYMGKQPLHVVGIVASLATPTDYNNNTTLSMVLPVRTDFTQGPYVLRTAPERREEVLKGAIAALERNDPNRLVREKLTYEAQRNDYFKNDRAMVGLLITVCISLLVVTALGIIGLASFWVQQRSKQIGIRRALGATRGQILRYFQTENFLLATLGIVLGMLAAYAINLALMNMYELPRMPLHYLPLGALLLWVLGQIAVFGPARRAAAVPPAVATRGA
jgi:putative ABC transport system permease protein